MRSIQDELEEESIVAAFSDHARAVAAAHALDRAGISPDHVGVTAGNVRQAREVLQQQGAVAIRREETGEAL